MPVQVHILVLAAGASSRMRGRDKLLEPVRGAPLLRQVAATALGTGAAVIVALPTGSTARRAVLSGLAVTLVEVPDAALGMSRALRRGVEAALASQPGPDDGLMILPADMPGFTTEALTRLITRFMTEPGMILRATTEAGEPGHPTIFPIALWPELAAISGDEGGRSVLQRYHDRVRLVALPGRMAVLDLDTPEDWTAYRDEEAP